ncbi:MAG: response regulator transcription factor [Patescibacteria group bacterium]
MSLQILIVEDDKDVADFLTKTLIEKGYGVRHTEKGSQVLPMIDERKPDILILDLKLPDMKGESVSKLIKKEYPELPIIMLTSKSGILDKVNGFDAGADDYITKPFEIDELLARIQAKVKRIHAQTDVLTVGDLVLDRRTINVRRGDKEIKVTPQEFKLLEYLMINKNTVLSRDMILSRVWSFTTEVESRVVDVYVGYLRKKIDRGFKTKLIHSIRGFGYMLKDENNGNIEAPAEMGEGEE